MKKHLVLALAALVLGVGSVSAQQFPAANVKNQQGSPVATRTLVDGKTPFVVTFWETICKPCIKELDVFAESMPDWLDEASFRIFAVSVDDARSTARARSLAAGRGWTSDLTMLYDENGAFKRALNVTSTPQLFLFDRNGKLVYSHTGYTPGSEVELFRKIKALQ